MCAKLLTAPILYISLQNASHEMYDDKVGLHVFCYPVHCAILHIHNGHLKMTGAKLSNWGLGTHLMSQETKSRTP